MVHEFPNKVDFYITNVCNFTCEHCNRFNNHHFTGWQRWSDYADIYAEWAKRVKLKAAVIMGGEPTLNPSLPDWIRGLATTFNVDVQTLTNGTRLLEARGLYDALALKNPSTGMPSHVGISIHNLEDFEEIRYNVTNFLKGPVREWGPILNKAMPENTWAPDYKADYSAYDSNGVLINAWISNAFTESAIIPQPDGTFRLHNNNEMETAQAFSSCAFAKFKSYHFIRGKLYRCAPAALMPEFDQQYPFELSPEDREILYSYQPLSIENYDARAQQFFATIDDPIPQCKFCSPNPQPSKIFPIRKGGIKNDA